MVPMGQQPASKEAKLRGGEKGERGEGRPRSLLRKPRCEAAQLTNKGTGSLLAIFIVLTACPYFQGRIDMIQKNVSSLSLYTPTRHIKSLYYVVLVMVQSFSISILLL